MSDSYIWQVFLLFEHFLHFFDPIIKKKYIFWLVKYSIFWINLMKLIFQIFKTWFKNQTKNRVMLFLSCKNYTNVPSFSFMKWPIFVFLFHIYIFTHTIPSKVDISWITFNKKQIVNQYSSISVKMLFFLCQGTVFPESYKRANINKVTDFIEY